MRKIGVEMSDLISRQKISYVVESLREDYISQYKMLMLINQMPSAEQWTPVTEALPEEGKSVIVCSRYGAVCIVELVKGISEETRKKMKNGEIDDPCEETWCLSDGYKMSKRSSLYKEGDEFGNNQKDYAWRNGPYHYSGQEFIAWMPLPEPYRGEQ